MGTDYLDLYIIRRFDYETPIEETMEALNVKLTDEDGVPLEEPYIPHRIVGAIDHKPADGVTVPVYTFGIMIKPPMIWHFCFFHQWFCLAVRETR